MKKTFFLFFSKVPYNTNQLFISHHISESEDNAYANECNRIEYRHLCPELHISS